MANKYYNPSGEPVDLSRARAVTLRMEFASIEQGFGQTEVDTNRSLKFPVGESVEIADLPADRAHGVLAFDPNGNVQVLGGASDAARSGQILGWDPTTGGLKYWDYAATITSPVNAAAASADAAATSEANAATSEANAAASELKASQWADNAYGSTVETGRYSAYHWSEQARKWAETPEDVEVVTGEYSAKHWAYKAAQYVAQGVIDDAAVNTLTTWSSQKIDTTVPTAVAQAIDTTVGTATQQAINTAVAQAKPTTAFLMAYGGI